MGKMFLKSFLLYSTREVGPSYTHNIWKKFNMRWSDFMPDNEVNDFIENNVSWASFIEDKCLCVTNDQFLITYIEIGICGKCKEDASD